MNETTARGRALIPQQRRSIMKRILIAAAALALIGAAGTPASAQVYLGADPGGVGVAVGPVGVGIGPDYWGYRHHRYYRDYAYAEPECRAVRERIVTHHGRVIWRTHRTCD
jgi:hypothetical protein